MKGDKKGRRSVSTAALPFLSTWEATGEDFYGY
jgi:hypothetical protein